MYLTTGFQFLCDCEAPGGLTSRFAVLLDKFDFQPVAVVALPPSADRLSTNHPPREGYPGPQDALVLGILLFTGLLSLGSSWRRSTNLGRWWGESKQ